MKNYYLERSKLKETTVFKRKFRWGMVAKDSAGNIL